MTDPSAPAPETPAESLPAELPVELLERRKAMISLEICFLVFIGLVVVAAFVEATGYAMVSARTPFVIMVPLFALILVQGWRLGKRRQDADLAGQIRRALGGGHPQFGKVVVMSLWMAVLMVLVVVLGHLVGVGLFGMALMWVVARERFVLSALVIGGTVLGLWLVFEVGFDVELYRGLVLRYFQGYRDF